jgi:hypothetical protein
MAEDIRWMRKGAEHPERSVVAIAERLAQTQANQCSLARRHFAVYEGEQAVRDAFGGMYPMIMPPGSDKGKGTDQLPISLNVAESVVDTAIAMTCKNQPRPKVSTRRGNYAQQRRARIADRAIEGQFHIEALDELGDEASRDAGVCGTGIIKVIPSILQERVLYERRMRWEVFADPEDARRGKPRCLYEIGTASKHVLAEEYPRKAEAILKAEHVQLTGDAGTETSDHVKVYEAWALPIGTEIPGRHVLCIDGALLLSEPWTWRTAPFIFTWWRKRAAGIWGRGIVEMIEPLQREIDRVLLAMQDGHKQYGKTFVGIPEGINDEEIDDEIGTRFKFDKESGQPVFFTPQIIQPEIYNHLWALVSKCYEMPGVSEARATSSDEYAGESGRAKVIRHNVEAGRLLKPARYRQDMVCSLADLTIQAWQYLDSKGVQVRVRTGVSTGHWKEEDFKDYALDRADYVVGVHPISKIESQPEQQLTLLEQVKNLGFVLPKGQFRRVLKNLDFESEVDPAEQSTEYVQRQIDSIVVDFTRKDFKSGAWEAPAPDAMCDLVEAFIQVQAAYLELANSIENDDEEGQAKLQQLRDFAKLIETEQKRLTEASVPAPAAVPPAAGAPAVPPPAATMGV